jgi:hypothetical protein
MCGLPCPLHYWRGGALLPHLFTLTLALLPRRYVFCGTCRQPVLKSASRTLSGTLLCGVRTFLFRHSVTKAAVRSSCLQITLYSIFLEPPRDFIFRELTALVSQPLYWAAILQAKKWRRHTCPTRQM